MLILASQSPRRKELLQRITEDFVVKTNPVDENLDLTMELPYAVEALAYNKALPVFKDYPQELVIGADTIVALDNQVLGKPQDEDDAVAMLTLLSDKVHKVITGVCLLNQKASSSFHVISEVHFYPLSIKEITDYVTDYRPLDKAGAYGIQDKGALFVREIRGDYYNIMGLPIARLNQELKRLDRLLKGN